jgi:hypothetical protein
VHAGAPCGGEPGPGVPHLPEHLLAFRVVAHRVGRRAGQDQVRVQPAGDVAGEPSSTPDGSFSRSQRDTCSTIGAVRMAATRSPSGGWFLGAKASMHGE